jgi:hypothetical protein
LYRGCVASPNCRAIPAETGRNRHQFGPTDGAWTRDTEGYRFSGGSSLQTAPPVASRRQISRAPLLPQPHGTARQRYQVVLLHCSFPGQHAPLPSPRGPRVEPRMPHEADSALGTSADMPVMTGPQRHAGTRPQRHFPIEIIRLAFFVKPILRPPALAYRNTNAALDKTGPYHKPSQPTVRRGYESVRSRCYGGWLTSAAGSHNFHTQVHRSPKSAKPRDEQLPVLLVSRRR